MMATSPPLARVALLSLAIGRLLLQWGANARTVHQAILSAARGLGCDAADVFCQHAAVIVMLRRGEESCVQMGKVGEHGVNLRSAEALLLVVDEVAAGRLDCDAALRDLEAIPKRAGSYPIWIVCLATGLACAAFGRLLGADWLSIPPILAGSATGQFLRHTMLGRKQNIFFTVTVVSFVSALIAGLGGRLLGDAHIDLTTVASILLLVPGAAILNSQVDAIDGRPNLAAARALRVVFILLFMTVGLLSAQQIVRI
jgi:uncharacterized membrane protein YjjP (DUF1212 family)